MTHEQSTQDLHALGLEAYGQGDWATATELFSSALGRAELDLDDRMQGIIQRDLSASLTRQDSLLRARSAASTSADIFSRLGDSREYGASLDAEARVYLASAIEAEQKPGNLDNARKLGFTALLSAGEAVDILGDAPKLDQYLVNAQRRDFATRVLYGERSEAFKSGVRSMLFSLVSESPRFVQNADTNKDFKTRTKVRIRQAGSVAILFAASAANMSGNRAQALKLVKKSAV